ncbi:MAG: mannitol dehydrogenase family protein [Hydrogenoanaerobacterium sp.]
MRLSKENLYSPFWGEHSYALPRYDREKVQENTKQNPQWLHLGAGNIFRAFIAKTYQEVLNNGDSETGIIVAEGFDYEIIEAAYKNYDNLSVSVALMADGRLEKTLVGSVVESLVFDTESEDFQRMKDIFKAASLKLVSFTITEKGYNLKNAQREYFPAVLEDFRNGPTKPTTYLGKVTALCYERYKAGESPLALLSMDNCSHNGDRLHSAVNDYAEKWSERGLVENGFLKYINDNKKISFPWSAIDKITPRPDETVCKALEADGLIDMSPIVTEKKTYVAPFVNAEETQYLVVEDCFPNGRPVFYGTGIYFTDRDTVDKFERMKVCTCLNPLHSALAIFGCLLGFKLISEEMKDASLRALATKIAFEEAMPVVSSPGIIDPVEFANTVLNVRFTNPYNPDTPQRIAMDTSQKLSIRFGETIKTYMASERLDTAKLRLIPLVLAGWCRYIMGIDDSGEKMEQSYDPMLPGLQPYFENIKLGDDRDFHSELEPILSNEKIFGVNLYTAGLGKLCEDYFRMLVSGKGAVRKTLDKIVG